MYASLRTEMDRLAEQLTLGQYRVGPEAVRDIARRIEGDHGFWDFEQRKAAHLSREAAQSEEVVLDGGGYPHRFLVGRYAPGEEPPGLAA